MKEAGEKITMLTAYDFPFALILDQAGIDIILVGDSLGPVVLGYKNTLEVTLEQMIYHTQAVTKACKKALVVFDMPFMTYQVSPEEALRNAGRAIKESGAHAVKLEGGLNMADTVRFIVSRDIPVMAHIGLTPQSIHRMGGHKVQGRQKSQAERLMEDALAVQDAGAFATVIEGVPKDLGTEITSKLDIPTIGIGAGPGCDGQVLVIHDMLGLYDEYHYTFVKQFANLKKDIIKATGDYINEVRDGKFPAEEHCYK